MTLAAHRNRDRHATASILEFPLGRPLAAAAVVVPMEIGHAQRQIMVSGFSNALDPFS